MTIDVWDTLLRRDCHPECIKLSTALHLFFGWRDQIKPEFRDSWLLYKARLEAESTIAQQTKVSGKDDEYEIAHVLDHWLTGIFADMPPPALSVRLSEYELGVEIARSYADPNISNFLLPYEAEKTIFLSDFYMGAEMLSRLLTSKGLNRLVSGGLSSCDVGFNKRSGKIFKHIHSIHAVTPEQHVHIGDNEWSDVASPRSLGVKALHYLPQYEHTERLAREHLFSSREALFDHILVECTTLAKDSIKGLSSEKAAALSLGVEAAPILIGFVLWFSEQAIQQKLDRLYFLTHEGEFFHRVFCAIFPKGQLFGHDLPTVEVLKVLSLSSFTPTIHKASITDMTRIWSLLKVKNVSSLFMTLGIDIKEFYELIKTLGLNKDVVISNPENSFELQRLFETPAFIEAAKKSLAAQTSLLQYYLKRTGLNEINIAGILDSDQHRTIQYKTPLSITDLHFPGMNLDLYHYNNLQFNNGSKTGYVTNKKISNDSNHLYRHATGMEFLYNSLYINLVGYNSERKRIKVQNHIEELENVSLDEFIKPLQEGFLLAAQIWQPYLERYVVSSNELHKLAVQVWSKLCITSEKNCHEIYWSKTQQSIVKNNIFIKENHHTSFDNASLSTLSTKRRLIFGIFSRSRSNVLRKFIDFRIPNYSMLIIFYLPIKLIKKIYLKIIFFFR